MLRKEYFVDFSCQYDLRFYPFDAQTCFMTFQVEEFNTSIVLRKDGESGVTFLGMNYINIPVMFGKNMKLLFHISFSRYKTAY